MLIEILGQGMPAVIVLLAFLSILLGFSAYKKYKTESKEFIDE